MRVVIDPAWSLARAAEAAFEAYVGSGLSSRGYRMSVLMAWANVVGRQRANQELKTLCGEYGGWDRFADALGVGAATLRKVRHHFNAVPDHVVRPNGAQDGDNEMTTLRGFERLGQGGYGEVWKAQDALGRNVAVKYMTASSDEAQRAVLAHATPLALLGSHQNVVFVYYCDYLLYPGSDRRVPAMVMEYVEGRTLRKWEQEVVDLARVLTVGGLLCRAVVFIHSRGLVHGDLHGDNVMVSLDDGVKVIDLLNDRRLSEFTSGVRRMGVNDDVESLKALLQGLLTAAGRSDLSARFELRVRGLRDAAGVGEVFSQLVPGGQPDSGLSGLPAFLLTWIQIERSLSALAGRSVDEKFVSVSAILDRVELSQEIRDEILELSKIRNGAVHGRAVVVDERIVSRAAVVGEYLRQFREQ